MSYYSIKNLALLSGIKPHTIRIWEQRYDLLTPMRTDSNFRYYSLDDVKYLIRLAGLNLAGNRISALAEKTKEEIQDEFLELRTRTKNPEVYVQSLLIDMLKLDEVGFKKNLKSIQSKIGFDDTCTKVCFRLIEKCNLVLTKRNMPSGYEHFAHALIRNYIISQLESSTVEPKTNAKTFILFLLENDFREFALQYCACKLKQMGHKVIYLGLGVSPDNILELNADFKIDYLLTTTHKSHTDNKIKKHFKKITDALDTGTLFVVNSFEAESLIQDNKIGTSKALTSDEALIDFLNTDFNATTDKQVA